MIKPLEEFIHDHFNVDELRQMGVLDAGMTPQQMADRLCQCLGLSCIYDYMKESELWTNLIPENIFSSN